MLAYFPAKYIGFAKSYLIRGIYFIKKIITVNILSILCFQYKKNSSLCYKTILYMSYER